MNTSKPTGPKKHLFEGQDGCKYTTQSVQKVFQQAIQKARTNKVVGIHGLSHSFATHLLEHGTDIKLIQELLGPNDLKALLRYTHVSTRSLEKITSPFDDLNLDSN